MSYSAEPLTDCVPLVSMLLFACCNSLLMASIGAASDTVGIRLFSRQAFISFGWQLPAMKNYFNAAAEIF